MCSIIIIKSRAKTCFFGSLHRSSAGCWQEEPGMRLHFILTEKFLCQRLGVCSCNICCVSRVQIHGSQNDPKWRLLRTTRSGVYYMRGIYDIRNKRTDRPYRLRGSLSKIFSEECFQNSQREWKTKIIYQSSLMQNLLQSRTIATRDDNPPSNRGIRGESSRRGILFLPKILMSKSRNLAVEIVPG